MKNTIKVTGSVEMKLIGPDGEIKQHSIQRNLVVTVGKTLLASVLAVDPLANHFAPYIALGSGTNAPSSGDTALQTEFTGGSNARVSGTLSSASNVWQNQATFAPGNCTGAVTEAGLFTASSSGTMFARQTRSAINKAAGDTLIVTWTVTFS